MKNLKTFESFLAAAGGKGEESFDYELEDYAELEKQLSTEPGFDNQHRDEIYHKVLFKKYLDLNYEFLVLSIKRNTILRLANRIGLYSSFADIQMQCGEEEGRSKTELESWVTNNIKPQNWQNEDPDDIRNMYYVITDYIRFIWTDEDAWLIEDDMGGKW